MTHPDFMSDMARGCAPGKVDPEYFFAKPNTDEAGDHSARVVAAMQRDQARKACRNCPFIQACFTWAEANGEQFGIWGGVSMSSDAERIKARLFYGMPVSAQRKAPAAPAVEPTQQETEEQLIERLLTSGGRQAFRALTGEQRAAVVRAGLARGQTLSTLSQRFCVNTLALQALTGEGAADSFDARVRQLHQQGHTDTEIGEALQVDPKTVRLARSRQGLPPLIHLRGQRLTPEQFEQARKRLGEQVRELYDEDLNDAEIGARLQMSPSRVHHIRTEQLHLPSKFGPGRKRKAVNA